MPLLNPGEITIAALMADIPMQRSMQNQVYMQMLTLKEGLELTYNPLERRSIVRYHMVGEFETLQTISNRLFGTPNYWLEIAKINGLQYPFAVYPGQRLIVPDIPTHD